ncbi:hypothetical protein [Mycobacterium intracellulare]|uniref:hypothetical protein n=2 Tax=Mycobacterium intracellulare TaxID=1767 RepID=UPI00295513CE|nr:hypothetical protein [Mycobacterium intracellulare]MDV6983463.1 hypothetical protein [Mycobacterium intracellulare]MDV7027110.1 hypothetical protein [Mycobacterium intracellulare]
MSRMCALSGAVCHPGELVFDRVVAGVPRVMRRMAQEGFAEPSRPIYGTPTPPRSTEIPSV